MAKSKSKAIVDQMELFAPGATEKGGSESAPSASVVKPTPQVAAEDPPPRSRVLIVDDHELLRDGMRLLIDNEPGLAVCGDAASEAEARRKITQLQPAVVVVDLTLHNGNGLDLIKWIGSHHPDMRVVVSTMHDESVYGDRVLRAGARGYVNKQDPSRTIVKAIQSVLQGRLHFSEAFTNQVMARVTAKQDAAVSPTAALSDRELEVFCLIGQGRTSDEIAKTLYLGRSTVDTYRQRLKIKLNLTTSAALAHCATQWVLEND